MAAVHDREGEEPAEQVWRAFVAIAMPAAQPVLEALQANTELNTLPIRWVMPEQLHLTLAFLGDLPRQALLRAWQQTRAASQGHAVLNLNLGVPQVFPDVRSPRVVAAEVGGEIAKLAALRQAIVAGLLDGGVSIDSQAFRPHVTLGRVGQLLRGQQPAISSALRAVEWPTVEPFTCPMVSFMRSELFPDGPKYTVLGESPLQKAK